MPSKEISPTAGYAGSRPLYLVRMVMVGIAPPGRDWQALSKDRRGPALCPPDVTNSVSVTLARVVCSCQTVKAAHQTAPWKVLERPPSEAWLAMLRIGKDLWGLLCVKDVCTPSHPYVGNRKVTRTKPSCTSNVGWTPRGRQPSCHMRGESLVGRHWSHHPGIQWADPMGLRGFVAQSFGAGSQLGGWAAVPGVPLGPEENLSRGNSR